MTSLATTLIGIIGLVDGSSVAIPAAAPPAALQASPTRADSQSRYEIAQMERILEGAVEHGATLTRDRLKAVLPPGDTVMTGENARVRGFRLEGYGVFFDVLVPPFDTETTLAWSVRTLDRNDLGLDSALRELRTFVKDSGKANLEQALKRIELQMTPIGSPTFMPLDIPNAREATGSTASLPAAPAASSSASSSTPPVTADPILKDPNEAYRTEVVQSLKEAMLDHSASLSIEPTEWLMVAARGNDDRPRLAPADSDARTRLLRLSGSDLALYLARQIGRQEALRRIEVKLF